jgi:hypothetical protein
MRQLENSPKHVACYEISVACVPITEARDGLTPSRSLRKAKS